MPVAVVVGQAPKLEPPSVYHLPGRARRVKKRSVMNGRHERSYMIVFRNEERFLRRAPGSVSGWLLTRPRALGRRVPGEGA